MANQRPAPLTADELLDLMPPHIKIHVACEYARRRYGTNPTTHPPKVNWVGSLDPHRPTAKVGDVLVRRPRGEESLGRALASLIADAKRGAWPLARTIARALREEKTE